MPELKKGKSEVDGEMASATEKVEIAGTSGGAEIRKKRTPSKSKHGDVTVTTPTKESPRSSTLRLFSQILPPWQNNE